MRRKKIKRKSIAEKSFEDEIKSLVADLDYISETDSEIYPFVGKQANEVSAEVLLEQLGRQDSVEERDFEDFYKRLTEVQDWFGDEEKKSASRFSDLKEFLLKNLKDVRVFKIGKIEVDIYTVGLDRDSILKGVWTKAVET